MGATDEVAAWTEGSGCRCSRAATPEPVALARMPVSAGTIRWSMR